MPKSKTLTELLKEHGIPDVPADDPIYRTKYAIYLWGPSKPVPQSQQGSSGIGEQQAELQIRLIDRSSKEPEDRRKFLYWLAAMSTAFRAPQAVVVPRVREVCWSAKRDGVSWRDVYELARLALSERYPQPPSPELVDPER